MRTALRYLLTILLGLAIGVGFAIHTVRAGAFASTIQIGPWKTGRDFGTADASARTRAVVALSGLLALPAREARYYTADTDTAGQPLDGRCRYRVTGGALPAQWWSLTVYDPAGYLVPNAAGKFSVESAAVLREQPQTADPRQAAILAAIRAAEQRWAVAVSPTPPAGDTTNWIPTGGLQRFALTLRLYLPLDHGRGDPAPNVLPSIAKEGC